MSEFYLPHPAAQNSLEIYFAVKRFALHSRARAERAMAVPVTVIVKGKNYAGEYQIDGGLLRVFFDGKSKTASANSANPEFLARLLLIELVCSRIKI